MKYHRYVELRDYNLSCILFDLTDLFREIGFESDYEEEETCKRLERILNQYGFTFSPSSK